MDIIPRSEAKAAGRLRYFTGVPCKRGHVSERLVCSAQCLECLRVLAKERYEKDPESARARSRNWHHSNREKSIALIRVRYIANAEARRADSRARYAADVDGNRAKGRARYAANAERAKARERRSRAARRQAVPMWFGELDDFVWKEATDLVDRRRVATGIEWHADHMIPLCAKTARGLHTWNNCQVIPASMNMFKKNKLIFTNPGEWLSAGM